MLAAHAPPGSMLQRPSDSSESNTQTEHGTSDVQEHEIIARDHILACCTSILDIIKAKYVVDLPAAAAADMFAGPGNVKIFRFRRGSAGMLLDDLEMARVSTRSAPRV